MVERTKKPSGGRPLQAEIIGGVEVIRDRPFCEVEAEQLEREYRAGNPLALFQCAALWETEGRSLTTLPAWAVKALAKLSAQFHREYEVAAVGGRRPPSLDVLAGFRGSKSSPVKKENRRRRALTYSAAYHAIVEEARRPYDENNTRWLCGPNLFRRLRKVDYSTGEYIGEPTKPVPVLNNRGEPTQAFATELYRSFGGHKKRGEYGNSEADDHADYKAARGLLRLARHLLPETEK